jgi:hypothetical protein
VVEERGELALLVSHAVSDDRSVSRVSEASQHAAGVG